MFLHKHLYFRSYLLFLFICTYNISSPLTIIYSIFSNSSNSYTHTFINNIISSFIIIYNRINTNIIKSFTIFIYTYIINFNFIIIINIYFSTIKINIKININNSIFTNIYNSSITYYFISIII